MRRAGVGAWHHESYNYIGFIIARSIGFIIWFCAATSWACGLAAARGQLGDGSKQNMALAEAQLAFFAREGYLVLRGAASHGP